MGKLLSLQGRIDWEVGVLIDAVSEAAYLDLHTGLIADHIWISVLVEGI